MNPDIEELEEILDTILRGIQDALQNGEVLSEEFQLQVAQEINNLTQEIDQLYEQSNVSSEQSSNVPTGPLSSPPSNDARLLWILAGEQPQAFISYLRTFPTPDTSQLLGNPAQLNAVIEQLQQMMPQGQQQTVDGIPQADLNSSNVWGANYDPKSGKMKVRFQGGSEYEYDGIPPNIFNAFIHGNASAKTKGKNKYGEWWEGKNPSLGAALNQYIKAGNFAYRKIR